jgi:hypothetical protein
MLSRCCTALQVDVGLGDGDGDGLELVVPDFVDVGDGAALVFDAVGVPDIFAVVLVVPPDGFFVAVELPAFGFDFVVDVPPAAVGAPGLAGGM